MLLFSFINILASFYDYIIKILVEKLDIVMIVYLDIILIYTSNMDYIDSI